MTSIGWVAFGLGILFGWALIGALVLGLLLWIAEDELKWPKLSSGKKKANE